MIQPTNPGLPRNLRRPQAERALEDAMNVAAILKQKGRDVETVAPSATLMQVTSALARRRIGAIVVVDERRKVQGIISERDIIRVLAESGPQVLTNPVSQVMTRNVISCGEHDTLAELMGAMTRGRFRHLPVTREGALIGIVSIGDVVKYHLSEVEMESSALKEYIAHT
jgi:CBS domain-containing protein